MQFPGFLAYILYIVQANNKLETLYANPSICRFLNSGRKMSARGAGSRALLSPQHSVMQWPSTVIISYAAEPMKRQSELWCQILCGVAFEFFSQTIPFSLMFQYAAKVSKKVTFTLFWPGNVNSYQRDNIWRKFIYYEKATKFCEIFTLLLSYVFPVKSKVKVSQNFVASRIVWNLKYFLL